MKITVEMAGMAMDGIRWAGGAIQGRGTGFPAPVDREDRSDGTDRQDTVEMSRGGTFHSLSGMWGRISGKASTGAVEAPVPAASAAPVSSPAVSPVVISSVASAVPGPAGAVLAAKLHSSVNTARNWDDACCCLKQGFKDIRSSAAAESWQKDMAAYGISVLSISSCASISAFLGDIVASSIAAGDRRPDLARLAADTISRTSSNNATSWEHTVDYYHAAFHAIKTCPMATADERANAAFGEKMTKSPGSDRAKAMVCKHVALAFEKGTQGMDVPALASSLRPGILMNLTPIAISAISNGALDLMRTGFMAIEENPLSTQEQKKLAAIGSSIIDSVPREFDACRLADLVNEALENSRNSISAAEIGKHSVAMASTHSSTLEKDRKSLMAGASLISRNPDSSPDEKKFGKWCTSILNSDMSDILAVRITMFLMKDLQKGRCGLDMKGLTEVAAETCIQASTWKEGLDMVRGAIKVIRSSPFVDEKVQALAKVQYAETAKIPDTKEGLDKAVEILKGFSRREDARVELEKMASTLMPGEKDGPTPTTVSIDDQNVFIDIDGVRIKRRDEET